MDQGKYEQQEINRYYTQAERAGEAPLHERQAARSDYRAATPTDIERSAEYILSGDYGAGPCFYARHHILGRPRMNQAAALAQMVACLDHNCPPAFARQAYNGWDGAKQDEVDRRIKQAITKAEQGGE